MVLGSVGSPAAVREARERHQFVVLELAGREYALAAGTVVQVVRMVAIRPMPEAPPSTAGVINLRGRLVGVIDLRTRLGLPAEEPGLSAHIVIVRANDTVVGLIVDAVVEVIELDDDAVEPPGEAAGHSGLVSAVARAHERLIMVLEVDRLPVDAAARGA